jgi:hypothetical protein
MLVRATSVSALLLLAWATPSIAQQTTDLPQEIWLAPEDSSACGEGLVANEATDGHCCWPGQMWSDERERCIGTPRCPTGWKVQGSLCVRGEVVPETQPRVAAPPATPVQKAEPTVKAAPPRAADATTSPEEYRQSQEANLATRESPETLRLRSLEDDEGRISYDGGPIPKGYHLTTRVRRGLMIPGSIMFGVSYGLTALVALTSLSSRNEFTTTECSNTDYFGLLPLAGAYVWAYQAEKKCGGSFGVRTFFGFVDSAVQVAGATMMILGYALPERYLVRDFNGLSLQLLPGTTGTSSGMTLAARF